VASLVVDLNRPDLLDDLVASLSRNGCSVRRLGWRSCAVEHAEATDDAEARVEVAFFVRAWQTRHRNARALLRA
jgi:imidazoleglycerol phosphate synthase glutamine amidotransferase subunit HisH